MSLRQKCKGGCAIGLYEDTIDESACSEIIEEDYNDHLASDTPLYCVMFNYCPRCGSKLIRTDKCDTV